MTEQLTPEAAMQICRNGGLVRDGGYSRGHWYAASYNELVLVEYGHARGRRTGLGEPKLHHPDYPPAIFARDYSPGKCILPGPEAKALVMSAPPGMLCTNKLPWDEELVEWWDGSKMRTEITVNWAYYSHHAYEIRIRPQWLEQQQNRFNAGNFEPAWKEKEMEGTDDLKCFGIVGDIEIYIRGHEVIFEDYSKNRMEVNAETLRDLLNRHFPAQCYEINDKVTGADALRALADGHWLKRDGCQPVTTIDGKFHRYDQRDGAIKWSGPSDDWLASTFTIIDDPRKPKCREIDIDGNTFNVYSDHIELPGCGLHSLTADDIAKIAAAMAELKGEIG